MHAPLTSTADPALLSKGGRVRLNKDDPDSVFEITGARIVWNQSNHIDGRQLLIMEIEVERDIPVKDVT